MKGDISVMNGEESIPGMDSFDTNQIHALNYLHLADRWQFDHITGIQPEVFESAVDSLERPDTF
jgi:hypothetical protein